MKQLPIHDRHGRTFDYVRIAVLDQCNLRCVYCMPETGLKFLPKDELMTRTEIARLVRAFAGAGVNKVRFTGGEPLIRPDIVSLVADAASTPGVRSVHLTSNGLRLADAVPDLVDAGLRGVNVSLDTLRADRFRAITRRDGVDTVRAGLDVAIEAGLSVKVNVVVLNGVNADEIPDLTALARELPITVRFIELMPFDARQIWQTGTSLRADELLRLVHDAAPGLVPADGSATEEHVFSASGWRGRVAVIPAYTRTMCGACNRIRVTADGNILNCLFSEHEFTLIDALRNGTDDDALVAILRTAMDAKARDGWAAAADHRDGDGASRISMTQIGG